MWGGELEARFSAAGGLLVCVELCGTTELVSGRTGIANDLLAPIRGARSEVLRVVNVVDIDKFSKLLCSGFVTSSNDVNDIDGCGGTVVDADEIAPLGVTLVGLTPSAAGGGGGGAVAEAFQRLTMSPSAGRGEVVTDEVRVESNATAGPTAGLMMR